MYYYRQKWGVCLVWGVFLINTFLYAQNDTLFLPDTVLNWNLKGDNGNNYGQDIPTGFNTYTYHCEGCPEIIVDILNMKLSRNTTVFENQYWKESLGGDTPFHYAAGVMHFRLDDYQISIMTFEETAAAREAIFTLAGEIFQRILLKRSESIRLQRITSHYFHNRRIDFFHPLLMGGNRHPIIKHGGFVFRPVFPVLFSDYSMTEGGLRIIVLNFLSKNDVESEISRLRGNVFFEKAVDGIVETERDWYGFKQMDNMLFLIFNARSKAQIDSVSGQLEHPIPD